MAAASGIVVSESAQDDFARAREEGVALVRLQIQNEKIEITARVPGPASDEEAFQLLQQHLIESPSFFCVLQASNPPPSNYIFVVYVPTLSSVRDRTLYAASREACKQGLGLASFMDEVYANGPEELTIDEFRRKQEHDKAEAPVTADEKLKEEEKLAERDMSKQSTASVVFPMTHDAQAALEKLSQQEVRYVILRLDGEKEHLDLVEDGDSQTIEEIASRLPPAEPRFVLFHFSRTFSDEQVESLLFFYLCPESSPIRLKMLYSTCKAPLLSACSHFSLHISKTLEVRDLAELDTKFLIQELHPQEGRNVPLAAAAAARPGRPGKGGRRLV